MRRALLGLIALAILMGGCGKYGPPVRTVPPPPIEESQTEQDDGEQETP
jgi:hypothetical protein